MAYLTDGHPTTITFYALGTGTTVKWKEQDVTPPGISSGGENDTTSMRNITWRTKQPKKLKSMTNGAMTCFYDPAVYDQLLLLIGVNGLIRIDFPDNSAEEVWGWLDDVTFNPCAEGTPPTFAGTIICSNQDNAQNEVGPDYQAAA